MISYKLAKKLKDAGFPQESNLAYTKEGKEVFKDYERGGCFWLNDEILDEDDLIYIPTLSELIKACRDENGKQLEMKLQYVGGTTSHWEIKCRMILETNPILDVAVAKLWLKLNEKNRRT